MQNTFQFSSILYRSTVFPGFLLMGLLLAGCGERPPYLEPTVTTPVGRPGVCSHCDKKIKSVTEDHLITIDGIQSVVCDKKCAADLKEWVAKQ